MSFLSLALGMVGVFLSASSVLADWSSKVEEIGFGERAAAAMAIGSNSGISFGCESNKQNTYIRVLTVEKISDRSIVGMPVSIELSIDNSAPTKYDAQLSVSRAETALISADLTPSEAKVVASLIGGAKRNVSFRVSLLAGKSFYSSTVSASGSRRAVDRVVANCDVDK